MVQVGEHRRKGREENHAPHVSAGRSTFLAKAAAGFHPLTGEVISIRKPSSS